MGRRLSPTGDLGQVVAHLSETRGHPVTIVRRELPHDGPSGAWVPTPTRDYIVVAEGSSPCREAAIICHEIGHIVLGHKPADLGSIIEMVAPDIHPEVAARFLMRHRYDDDQEREAEEFGTLLAAEHARRQMQTHMASDMLARRLR